MIMIAGGLAMVGTMVAMAAFYCMLALGAKADERNERLLHVMQRERHAHRTGDPFAFPRTRTPD